MMLAFFSLMFTACGDSNEPESGFPIGGSGKDYAPESLMPGTVLTWYGKMGYTGNDGTILGWMNQGTAQDPFRFQIISSNEGLSNYAYAYSSSFYTYKKLEVNKARLSFKVECLLMGTKYVHYDYDMILEFTSPTTVKVTGTMNFDFLYVLDCVGTLILLLP